MKRQSKGKRHSKAEIYPIVQEWLETGERKKDLCQRHGIQIYILDYWLRKYKSEKHPPTNAPSNFIPIHVADTPISPALQSDKIEISYPDGTAIRLPFNYPVAQLRSLLSLNPTHV